MTNPLNKEWATETILYLEHEYKEPVFICGLGYYQCKGKVYFLLGKWLYEFRPTGDTGTPIEIHLEKKFK